MGVGLDKGTLGHGVVVVLVEVRVVEGFLNRIGWRYQRSMIEFVVIMVLL